jgi:hypothetical protein
MDVRQYLHLKALISFTFIVTMCNCEQSKTQNDNNILYLELYGNCEKCVKLSIDEEVIFDIDTNTHNRLMSIRKGPLSFNHDEIMIRLFVDQKDTTFRVPLERHNYWLIGYSKIRKEFQFTTYDSTQFFHPVLDNDIITP